MMMKTNNIFQGKALSLLLLSATVLLISPLSKAFTFVNHVPSSSCKLHQEQIAVYYHPNGYTKIQRQHHAEHTCTLPHKPHKPHRQSPTLFMSTSINNDITNNNQNQQTKEEDDDEQQQQQQQQTKQTKITNAIPPPDTPNLSKLEHDFYTMMREFTSYTSKDINSIPNTRYRALYEGVIAGSYEILVLKAFAIVYNDYLPVRIAGRMIYRHLKHYMTVHIEKRVQEEERVQNSTGLSLDVIEDGRKAYMAILNVHDTGTTSSNNEVMGTNNGDMPKDGPAIDEGGQLTMDQLVNSGIIETIVELLDYDSFQELVHENMEHDKDGKLSFEKFMIGLQRCSQSVNEAASASSTSTKEKLGDDFCGVGVVCDLSEVFNEIVERMEPIDKQKQAIPVDTRKQKFSDRYDNMLTTFEEWEDTILSGDTTTSSSSSSSSSSSGGRIGEVLRGCFAGAKNEKIVNALKIVYMDYSALRVGGDLIFKLMTALVRRQQKRASRKKKAA